MSRCDLVDYARAADRLAATSIMEIVSRQLDWTAGKAHWSAHYAPRRAAQMVSSRWAQSGANGQHGRPEGRNMRAPAAARLLAGSVSLGAPRAGLAAN